MSLDVSVHPYRADGMRLVQHEAQDGTPPFVVIKLGPAVGHVSLLFHDLDDLSAFAELVRQAQDALVDLQRAVLASTAGGELFVDSLKGSRARTVPLVANLVPIIEQWAIAKRADQWLFSAPQGGPLSESNWKRSVGWSKAIRKIGKPKLRVHDLRHTCASVWLGGGADPKVVQRILGHASAAMTMDLYGHLIDQNLWDAAKRIGGTTGASDDEEEDDTDEPAEEDGA